jgi:hypothetical protein
MIHPKCSLVQELGISKTRSAMLLSRVWKTQLLTGGEARRIAVNITKLPGLLGKAG